MPRTDNGNYIWIQAFFSALNSKGRAGFVMANSASDAGGSELEIRKEANRVRRSGGDDFHRPELFLHGHASMDALVLR